jgi:hypothetical protein
MNVGLLYAGLAATLSLAASRACTLTLRAGTLARLRPAVALGLAITNAVDVGLLLARLIRSGPSSGQPSSGLRCEHP